MAKVERAGKVKELYDQAVNLQVAKDYAKAIVGYDEVIKLMPDDWQSYGNRGDCYWELEQEEKALADKDMAISLEPANSFSYSARGLIYFQIGETEKAQADVEKAAELNAEYADLVYMTFAENVEKLTGNKHDAAVYLKKAIERNGEYSDEAKKKLANWGM